VYLTPLWSDEVLKTAIEVAHQHGARVTAHVFGEDALPGLINAGIDCIEHGTGLTDDTIELMVEHGTALVPTLINIENFPGIADSATRYPTYAEHMRDLYAKCYPRMAAARDAGVPVYAGTDAGSMVAHGRIADEVEALKGIGMSPGEALGAACWDARRWLGRPGLEHGASADLLCYNEDPRQGPAVLNRPDLVVLRGQTFWSTNGVVNPRQLLDQTGFAIYRCDRYQPVAASAEAKLVHALGFDQCAQAYVNEIGAPAGQIDVHYAFLRGAVNDPTVMIALFSNTQYIA
jgi:cytosine/adenosine deaminase-related metal-dependent hydrolase